ncbi:MAG: sugar ABC transporter substrate-binding protein [Spirochaetaceae bacterium]|nr:MAG: sugar ABC transporter substrate-binding protein [Spirochaetaceae bacterium]
MPRRSATPAVRFTVACTLALSLLVAGCVPGPVAEGAPGAAEAAEFSWRQAEGTGIVLMASEHPWVDLVRSRLPEFTERTGIPVTVELYPEEQFRAKRQVEMLSGISQVDLFMIMPGNSLSEYHAREWVEPLEDFIADPRRTSPEWSLDAFYESALTAARRAGRLYAVPLILETSLLAYNRDILRRFGLDPPETMAELQRVAQTVHRESGGTIAGITLRGNGASATSQWSGFLHSFGGAWVHPEGGAAIDAPEAIDALRFYGMLLREYGPPGATRNGWYESVSLFARGEAAMIYDSNVFRSHYEDPLRSRVADSVGYRMIPEGPAGRIPHISHWGLAINPASSRKEAAWLFIQWASSEPLAHEAQRLGIPSARLDSWDFEETDARAVEWTAASMQSYEIGTPWWNPPVIRIAEARDVVGRAIVASVLGQDVARAARDAATGLDQLLDESGEGDP